jgi:uncharacterized protein YeaO (DUF488 family)
MNTADPPAAGSSAEAPSSLPATEFRGRYRRELAAEHARLEKLRARAQTGPVTILYAARDREHNNAVVLAEPLRTGES